MLRFKQYLAEDMPEYQLGSPRGYSPSAKIPKAPSTKLGSIGPYDIHHYKDAGLYDEMVSIQHSGKQVGEFTFYRVKGKPIRIDMPMMAPKHRGKKALVKDLVPKVYAMIADKFGTIESGTKQTKGGRSIWNRLSKMRPVSVGRSSDIVGRSSKELKTKLAVLNKSPRYDPKKHDKIAYGPPETESSRDITLRLKGRKR